MKLTSMLRNMAFISFACLMTYLAGKDTNWDLINYHFYIAHAWSHSKYLTDYMGAGPNSYFNPFGYLPFYWMVMANWPSIAIGLLLGAFHGISLILLWEISARFFFKNAAHARWLALISVLLAASSPLFAGTLGSTFLEPTLAVFVFGGLLLVGLGCESRGEKKSLLLYFSGGLLLGIATGFKLTNIIFIAGSGLSLLFVTGIRLRGLAAAAIFSIGVIFGCLISNGWWGYLLFHEFGNPFFPFFNEIFQSSYFSIEKLEHDRFKPVSIVDFAAFPFRMAYFHSWIYAENNAPDVRPALLIIFCIALAAKKIVTKIRRSAEPKLNNNTARNFIILFFIFSTAFWLWTTGNGRYGLTLLLLIGPILIFAINKLLSNERRTLILGIVILILQVTHAATAGNPRWTSAEWTPHWLEVFIPNHLKDTPYAYLSLGLSRSNSIVAPFVHPKSNFLSLSGGTYTFRPDGPGNTRIRTFIKNHSNNLRMLVTMLPGHNMPTPNLFNSWDMATAPWHLKIVRSDCEFLDINFDSNETDKSATLQKNNPNYIPMLSCALEASEGEDADTQLERKRLTLIFDRIEVSCPLLFSPRGWYLSRHPFSWKRTYLKSDVVLSARKGRISLSKYDFGPFDVDMGSIDDWENGTSKFVCERLPKPW